MSFQSPLLLIALLVVPLAAIAYRAHARRAERAVSAFAPAPVLPSVAPRRPGWRRHAPYALYALALYLGWRVLQTWPGGPELVEELIRRPPVPPRLPGSP